ncbi:MAG: GNAT family N-acetyltransferase [Anaerolineae bacterium]|nr:GNAT family N-acetyltransferase [Anaerolineae bacterium]
MGDTLPTQPQPKQQLWMVRFQGRLPEPAPARIPEGYALRTYREGDLEAYVELMRKGGFDFWTAETAREQRQRQLPDGLFFAVHTATGHLAATAAAECLPPERAPIQGAIGWVAADPEHRGRGLGYAVCVAATRRLIAEGHRLVGLATDDHRLPAIHIYLKLGFVPWLYAPDMEGRWRALSQALGVAWESLGAVTDLNAALRGR